MSTRALERLYVYWMVSTLLLITLGVIVSLLCWGEIQAQNRRIAALELRAGAMTGVEGGPPAGEEGD